MTFITAKNKETMKEEMINEQAPKWDNMMCVFVTPTLHCFCLKPLALQSALVDSVPHIIKGDEYPCTPRILVNFKQLWYHDRPN